MLRKFPSALRWRQLPPILMLPVLLAATVGALLGSTIAALAWAGYLAVVVASAAHVAARLRDFAALPHAAAAFLIVHLAWSTGFWISLFSPGGAAPPRGR